MVKRSTLTASELAAAAAAADDAVHGIRALAGKVSVGGELVPTADQIATFHRLAAAYGELVEMLLALKSLAELRTETEAMVRACAGGG